MPGRTYQAPDAPPAPATPQANGCAPPAAARADGEPAFRFAVPGPKFLDFSGPGGDAFAAGAPRRPRPAPAAAPPRCAACRTPKQHDSLATGARRRPRPARAACRPRRARAGCTELFAEAVRRLEDLGGVQVPIDFAPFAEVARLLYESAFIAERYSGIREFLEKPHVRPPPRPCGRRARQRTAPDSCGSGSGLAAGRQRKGRRMHRRARRRGRRARR